MKLKNIIKESKHDLTEELAFPQTLSAHGEYVRYMKKASSLKSKITKSFNQEMSKYLNGKWDIIQAPGDERWGGDRKTMRNDINNWYNAKIKSISLDFWRDPKNGILVPVVDLNAYGDNVSGDAVFRLEKLKIYKAYQSPEGKEYKKGY